MTPQAHCAALGRRSRIKALKVKFRLSSPVPSQEVTMHGNDGGSRWWQDATGAVSRAGMLTFLSTPEGPNEFRIL